jgi:hypothetical protein
MAQQTWTDPAYAVTFKPVHADELQDAINAWEAAYDITLTTFTDEEPTTNTRIDALLFTEMQDALDALKTLIGEGTFSWTAAAGYMFGDTPMTDGGDPLVEEVRDSMNYIQNGKCYQCHSCDTDTGCSCESTCYEYACNCDASCDGNVDCTCDLECHGYSACSCDSQCHGYQACQQCNTTCNLMDCKSGDNCNCNQSCNGYIACSCNQTCHGHSACSCNSTCFENVDCTCDSTCNSETPCSCNATCYEDSCDQCHVADYEYPWT